MGSGRSVCDGNGGGADGKPAAGEHRQAHGGGLPLRRGRHSGGRFKLHHGGSLPGISGTGFGGGGGKPDFCGGQHPLVLDHTLFGTAGQRRCWEDLARAARADSAGGSRPHPVHRFRKRMGGRGSAASSAPRCVSAGDHGWGQGLAGTPDFWGAAVRLDPAVLVQLANERQSGDRSRAAERIRAVRVVRNFQCGRELDVAADQRAGHPDQAGDRRGERGLAERRGGDGWRAVAAFSVAIGACRPPEIPVEPAEPAAP